MAAKLQELGVFNHDAKELKVRVQEMINAGSRYRNLEKKLGSGVVFLLGTDIPESSYAIPTSSSIRMHTKIFRWTKLLPKSGKKFTSVINNIRKTAVPNLATTLSDVQTAILEVQLVKFRLFQPHHLD